MRERRISENCHELVNDQDAMLICSFIAGFCFALTLSLMWGSV